MTSRVERIRQRLLETLAPQECLVTDESALHVGHAERRPAAATSGYAW